MPGAHAEPLDEELELAPDDDPLPDEELELAPGDDPPPDEELELAPDDELTTPLPEHAQRPTADRAAASANTARGPCARV